ncbi:MAG TPA: MFS transporter [Chlamydiales bacterium]|nr:MFS transporter [Chlamydiales bacterium]
MKFWRTIFTFVPGTALFFMDQTILPVALPAIQNELGATDTELQWSVNAYILAIAIFLLIGGKLGDSKGLRKIWGMGIVGFTVSSILCGLSITPDMLIWARFLQGAFVAFMIPPQNSLLRHMFPATSLGRAMGCVVSIGSIFLMLGPIVGGYLTETLSWRWIFWVNVPIGVIGLWTALTCWPSPKSVKSPIDKLGFCYFATGVGALTIFFMQVTEWGWTSPLSLTILFISLIFLSLLFLREKKVPHPFLEISLFKRPLFAAINISVSTAQIFMMVGVFWLLYFQQVLHYTTMQAGVLSFISAFPVIFASPLAGYLSDRLGPKLPVAIGYLFLIYTCFFLGFFPMPSLASLVIALFIFGMGIPFLLTPSFSKAITTVPPTKTAIAVGTLITLRMVAGSMGLACMYLLQSSVYTRWLPVVGAKEAYITSFSTLHFALGFLIIVSFAFSFLLHTRKSGHELPEFPGEGWD